jgi:hypothetical protein
VCTTGRFLRHLTLPVIDSGLADLRSKNASTRVPPAPTSSLDSLNYVVASSCVTSSVSRALAQAADLGVSAAG